MTVRRAARVHAIEEIIAVTFLRLAAALVIAAPVTLICYLGHEAAQLFVHDHVAWQTFLFSPVFDPDGGRPGAAAFVAGSLAVTATAVLIAAPLGYGAAVCIAEIAPARIAKILRGVIEILAGIPSVVFGWIGLTSVVPLVRAWTGTSGFGILAAALVLALMIVPTLVTLSVDGLRAVPHVLRENSTALGATRGETIARAVIPAARASLLVALILAGARAIGETLAVEMTIGNAGILPHDLVHAAATLPTEIVLDMGGAPPGSLLEHALFAMAFLLLVISTGLISLVRRIGARRGAL